MRTWHSQRARYEYARPGLHAREWSSRRRPRHRRRQTTKPIECLRGKNNTSCSCIMYYTVLLLILYCICIIFVAFSSLLFRSFSLGVSGVMFPDFFLQVIFYYIQYPILDYHHLNHVHLLLWVLEIIDQKQF